MAVWFVDTSVLCNLLAIPQKSQHVEKTRRDFAEKVRAKHQLILPFAAIVETGNFVAQIKDGNLRRKVAQNFSDMLNDTACGKLPWVPNDFRLDRHFLAMLVRGLDDRQTLVELAQQQVGLGDLSIVLEMRRYKERTNLPHVDVWSYDRELLSRSSH